MITWQAWHQTHFDRVESALGYSTPKNGPGLERLEEAMKYAVLAGGKRIRPLLVFATFELADPVVISKVSNEAVDQVAIALELIHTFSLVHDDLPAMDNDDLRRGKPTTHKVYDEATALLVGDALQAQAFQVLSTVNLEPALQVALIRELSFSAGAHGMCGGQAIDLANVGHALTLEELQRMHQLKTGALLRAAIRMGARLAYLSEQDVQLLDQFANDIGLGFQVVDDILDATQDSATLGKTAGKDAQDNKPTFVSLMGLDLAKEFSNNLLTSGLNSLNHFGAAADPLRMIAKWAIQRNF